MPKPKSNRICGVKECSKAFYAKDMCKYHYMDANRVRFSPSNAKPKEEFDYEDFWQFVKKELSIG
jgi:hypothetical protein